MSNTIHFYDENAPDLAATYESVDFSRLDSAFAQVLEPGCRVLELGCGSGRDAAALSGRGFDVTAVDGSDAMIREAGRLHPELRGRLTHLRLPDTLPFETDSFHGAYSWAMIMHLPEDELPKLFAEIARVVAAGGVFGYSVNTERGGLDTGGNDARGRHFTCLTAAEWEQHHRRVGFETIYNEETDDIVGRPGIRWVTFFARKS